MGVACDVLMDTGADLCVMSRKMLDKLREEGDRQVHLLTTGIKLNVLNRGAVAVHGLAEVAITPNSRDREGERQFKPIIVQCCVIDDPQCVLLVGAKSVREERVDINCGEGCIQFKTRPDWPPIEIHKPQRRDELRVAAIGVARVSLPRESEESKCRLLITAKTPIPAGTERWVRARLDRPEGRIGDVGRILKHQSLSNLRGAWLDVDTNVVEVSAGRRVLVRIRNTSHKRATLSKNQLLEWFLPLRELSETELIHTPGEQ